jgi:hypothetical protein
VRSYEIVEPRVEECEKKEHGNCGREVKDLRSV